MRYLNIYKYIIQYFPMNFKNIQKKTSIFSLSGAALLPQTQLTLNLFEPKYVQMLNNSLSTPHKLIKKFNF